MSKIDIDKFVASVYKRLLSQMGFIRMPNTDYSREFLKALDEALKDNGLKFWCDEIVEIEPKLSNLEQNGKNSKENIVPKFKKGDLVKVQYPSGIHTSIEGELCRVVDVQDEHYIVKAPDGNKYQEPMSYQDYWTNIVSSKPANFAKSSKDLQEAPHGDDCKGCKGFEETGKCYCEGYEGMPQELTEFEKAVQSILYTEITNAVNIDPYVLTANKIKQASKMLLDKARKYYKEKNLEVELGLLSGFDHVDYWTHKGSSKSDKELEGENPKLQVVDFDRMLQWEREKLIDKACEWLREHKDYVATEDNGISCWIPERFIEDFKEYMSNKVQ